MITKNPLSSLLSTSEGFVVILLIGVVWQVFGWLSGEQTYDATTSNMIEMGKWWLGMRTGLKVAEKGADSFGGGKQLKELSDAKDEMQGILKALKEKG